MRTDHTSNEPLIPDLPPLVKAPELEQKAAGKQRIPEPEASEPRRPEDESCPPEHPD